MRTEELEIQGGGNCGNALTGVARLGVSTRVLSTIGTDALGDKIVEGFQEDGVGTDFLQRIDTAPTPFTYIIVDKAGGTRTCIHTPGADLQPADVQPETCRQLLDGAALVYFDGRLTKAALVVAKVARQQGIPILVEAERVRPELELLMAEADYLVMSQNFPQEWTGEDTIGDGMLAAALRLPYIKWMVTTLGKRGSVLLHRPAAESNGSHGEPAESRTLGAVIDELLEQASSQTHSGKASSEPACRGAHDIPIYAGHTACTSGPVSVTFDRASSKERAKLQAALRASAKEAGMGEAPPAFYNSSYMAQTDNSGDDVATTGSASQAGSSHRRLTVQVHVCGASPMQTAQIADTTGAGDAYLASLMYGLLNGKSVAEMMRLGSLVAACKCTQLGARPGLPTRDQIDAAYL